MASHVVIRNLLMTDSYNNPPTGPLSTGDIAAGNDQENMLRAFRNC